MPKIQPTASRLTKRNNHRLGIIRASAYSPLCRIRHRREIVTPGSEGAGGRDPLRPPDTHALLRRPRTRRSRYCFFIRTHFAMKMLWPTTPPLDVQLDARLRSDQTISTADVDASRMSGLDLPSDDPSPPAAQAGLLCGGRSRRVRPNAGDQSSKSLFLWRSNVAVQPGCQRRQQRRRQWEGFTYHDSEDSFGG
jgi:hypothetical protein